MLKYGPDLLSCLAFVDGYETLVHMSSAKSKSSSCVKIFHWIEFPFPFVFVFMTSLWLK